MSAEQPALAAATPLLAFLRTYLAREKATRFGEKWVLNTHFPPYPSAAFERFLGHCLGDVGSSRSAHRLYSVTLAVTNRCNYGCWHCYNADRSPRDVPPSRLQEIASVLQGLGAAMITLTGGEPLLRPDLEEIAAAFDERSCVVLGTTGAGLTRERARLLRQRGVFAVGVSLDVANDDEHDRLRGRRGAFRTALSALRLAGEEGLYPYVVSVATHRFVKPDRFWPFLRFAADSGAREVHLGLERRNADTITLLGGEPTLHPELSAVIRHVRSRGLTCQLLTNGVRFQEAD